MGIAQKMACKKQVVSILGSAFLSLVVGGVAFAATLSAPVVESEMNGAGSAQFTVTYPSGTTALNVNIDQYTDSTSPYQTTVIQVPADSTSDTFVLPNMISGQASYVEFQATDTEGDVSPWSSFTVAEVAAPYQNVWIENWSEFEDWLSNFLQNFFTVTPAAQTTMNNGLQAVQSAIGVTQTSSLATTLQSFGTFTPNDSALTFSVPIIDSKYGDVNASLFSSSQLAKFTWLPLLRSIAKAVLWISFASFVILRFAPVFMV